MDALFDSWDPDRVGAIEMDELCNRLRGADVHKGAESPLSLSGRACGKDTSDASPTASRRKSNASAASVQQQKNLERDRKVLFQRKMDAAARVTARREVDRQLLRDVTKLYAVYLQKCTYAAYTLPHQSRLLAPPHAYYVTFSLLRSPTPQVDLSQLAHEHRHVRKRDAALLPRHESDAAHGADGSGAGLLRGAAAGERPGRGRKVRAHVNTTHPNIRRLLPISTSIGRVRTVESRVWTALQPSYSPLRAQEMEEN